MWLCSIISYWWSAPDSIQNHIVAEFVIWTQIIVQFINMNSYCDETCHFQSTCSSRWVTWLFTVASWALESLQFVLDQPTPNISALYFIIFMSKLRRGGRGALIVRLFLGWKIKTKKKTGNLKKESKLILVGCFLSAESKIKSVPLSDRYEQHQWQQWHH